MSSYSISTSIVYPNANPHLGFAMEMVQADFLARYHRLQGYQVWFQTGTDEHGLKIQTTAEKAGKSPKELVDGVVTVVQDLANGLNISADRFIRTTDADHKAVAQALWKMCSANGDIYKQTYQAWYDIKEEAFLGRVEEYPDSSVFDTKPEFIEKIEEENYFFALSKYTDEVVGLLESGAVNVVPASRRLELLNFVKEHGLQDVSISREKAKLSWGIEVPGDDAQVMYVWFDALTNYLSGTSTIDERGIIIPGAQWPMSMHCIGKDISRFHALLWLGMLRSAGLPLPKEILVHGFINIEGQKMSKSLGNVAYAEPWIARFGADATRWFLLKECSTSQDYDLREGRPDEVYAADLANDFGNLVSRVWSMNQKYLGGVIPTVDLSTAGHAEREVTHQAFEQFHASIDRRDIKSALEAIAGLVSFANRRIEELKPWVLAKDPDQRAELEEVMYELLEVVRSAAVALQPVMPGAAARVLGDVLNLSSEPVSFVEGEKWGVLQPGHTLGTEQVILFPRIEA